MGAMALAACGGPSTSGATKTGGADETDWAKVKPAKEIDFWSSHPGGSQDVEKKLIADFEAKNDIKVNLVTAGSNYEDVAAKFQTAQTGSQVPALVIFSDVWWFRYFLGDSIIPVDSLSKHLDIDTGDFQDTLYKDYSYGGNQWALPYARSTPLFYYNKSHWKTAGLPDRAPKTWEEFDEWAPKLQAANLGTKSVFEYGAIAGYSAWIFQNGAWGWGGEYSDKFDMKIDGDKVVAAAEYCQKNIKDGIATVASNEQGDDLSAGACSCTMTSTGGLVGIIDTAQFEVGVGNLPGGPEASEGVCPTGGAGLGIPKKAPKEQQLAAAMFLKFVTEPENTAQFSGATGYMPTRKSADMKSVIAKTPQIQVAIDQLPKTRSQDYARVFLPAGDKTIADGMGRIWTQGEDAKTVLTDVKGKLASIYTQDVKPKL